MFLWVTHSQSCWVRHVLTAVGFAMAGGTWSTGNASHRGSVLLEDVGRIPAIDTTVGVKHRVKHDNTYNLTK